MDVLTMKSQPRLPHPVAGASFLLLISMLLPGCVDTPNGPNPIAKPAARSSSEDQPDPPPQTVITDAAHLSRHVGRVVTLRGVQSRSKIPYVLDVEVDGDYGLAEKSVEVTGRLSSHEVTQADVDAFDEAQSKQPFAAARPTVGTHYSLVDPETGELAHTRLRRAGTTQ